MMEPQELKDEHFYWVRVEDEWTVAQFTRGHVGHLCWSIAGCRDGTKPDEVGEEIVRSEYSFRFSHYAYAPHKYDTLQFREQVMHSITRGDDVLIVRDGAGHVIYLGKATPREDAETIEEPKES